MVVKALPPAAGLLPIALGESLTERQSRNCHIRMAVFCASAPVSGCEIAIGGVADA
jgi:hypothetical protein